MLQLFQHFHLEVVPKCRLTFIETAILFVMVTAIKKDQLEGPTSSRIGFQFWPPSFNRFFSTGTCQSESVAATKSQEINESVLRQCFSAFSCINFLKGFLESLSCRNFRSKSRALRLSCWMVFRTFSTDCGNKSQTYFLSRPGHWILEMFGSCSETLDVGSCKLIDSRILHLHQGLFSAIPIFFSHFPSICINLSFRFSWNPNMSWDAQCHMEHRGWLSNCWVLPLVTVPWWKHRNVYLPRNK